MFCGKEVVNQRKRVVLGKEMAKFESQLLLVSCLMITKNRANFAMCAVRCFLNQTYPNKELLIIDDGECGELARFIDHLDDTRIRYIRLAPGNNALGDLRNRSVALAQGEWVCQWDDDDMSDPPSPRNASMCNLSL